MRKVILLSSMLLVIGAAAGCGSSKSGSSGNQATSSAPASVNPQTATTFNFVVKNGHVAAPPNFKVTQGQNVIIKVTADVSDEVHLHGYNLKSDVTPTTTAEIQFNAKDAGRFEMELENAKKTLGELEVSPK